jgi:hypothetical protein
MVLAAACGAESPDGTTIAAAPVTTMEDTPVTFTLDVTGAYTTAGILQPTHGNATIDGLVVTYTPEPNYFGADVFRAYVSTDGPVVETAIDVTVLPVNDPPVGWEDVLDAVEDTPFTVPAEVLLANDMEIEGEPVTLTSVGNAMNGTVSLDQGNVTFVPDANFFGSTTFDYVTTDGTDSSTATVQLHVRNVNDPPTAVGETAIVAKNTGLNLSIAALLENDSDIDGTHPTLAADGMSCANCTIGTVSLSTIRVVPAQDFTGIALFQYTITDDVATATATVTITVTP